MNESQATRIAEVYAEMGYEVSVEQTGGDVWLAYVFRTNSEQLVDYTAFGVDTVSSYDMAGNETASIVLTGGAR